MLVLGVRNKQVIEFAGKTLHLAWYFVVINTVVLFFFFFFIHLYVHWGEEA